MKINEIIPVVLNILKDIRVIGIFIFVLIYLNFIFFVCRYKKSNKPKGIKKIKFKTSDPKTTPEKNEEEAEDSDLEE